MADPQDNLSFVQRLFTHKLVFWVPALIMLVLDLWSKAWAQGYLTTANSEVIKGETLYFERKDVPAEGIPFWEGVLHFRWAENTGAAFSIGEGQTGMLLFVAIGVLGILLYYIFRTPKARWVMLLALGMVAGGAIGNIYDRTTHRAPNQKAKDQWDSGSAFHGVETHAAVRDFLYFPFDIPIYATWGKSEVEIAAGRTRKYPVFNVADVSVVSGVILMILVILFTKEEEEEAKESVKASDEEAGAA